MVVAYNCELLFFQLYKEQVSGTFESYFPWGNVSFCYTIVELYVMPPFVSKPIAGEEVK